MEDMRNTNVNETVDNTADQAAENTEKKFGAGEYAVLASAVVGACTIAVGACKGLKKGYKTARNWFSGVRAEAKKRIAEQEEIEAELAFEEETEEKED